MGSRGLSLMGLSLMTYISEAATGTGMSNIDFLNAYVILLLSDAEITFLQGGAKSIWLPDYGPVHTDTISYRSTSVRSKKWYRYRTVPLRSVPKSGTDIVPLSGPVWYLRVTRSWFLLRYLMSKLRSDLRLFRLFKTSTVYSY